MYDESLALWRVYIAIRLLNFAGGVLQSTNGGFVVAAVGSSVVLNCQTTANENIKWNHYVTGSKTITRISSGPHLNPGLSATHSVMVNSTVGLCSLVIRGARITDAGRYQCVESLTQGSLNIELLVMAFDPVCDAHLRLTEPEIHVTCHLEFSGNWQPSIECEPHNIAGQLNLTTSVPFKYAAYSKRFIKNDSVNRIDCSLFSQNPGSSTAPTSLYNWTIQFFIPRTTGLSETSNRATLSSPQVSVVTSGSVALELLNQTQGMSLTTNGEVRWLNGDMVTVVAMALGFFTVLTICATIIVVVMKKRRNSETVIEHAPASADASWNAGNRLYRRGKSSSAYRNASTTNPPQHVQPTNGDIHTSANHQVCDLNPDGGDSDSQARSYESLDDVAEVYTSPVPAVYDGLAA